MAQNPKNEPGTLILCDHWQADGESVKDNLRKPFLPEVAAIIFQKLLFFWFPSMSVNGLGRVAKRCAYPRTRSPDVRSNEASDTAVRRYPAPLLLHPYDRFTCGRTLHLHVRNLLRVRI